MWRGAVRVALAAVIAVAGPAVAVLPPVPAHAATSFELVPGATDQPDTQNIPLTGPTSKVIVTVPAALLPWIDDVLVRLRGKTVQTSCWRYPDQLRQFHCDQLDGQPITGAIIIYGPVSLPYGDYPRYVGPHEITVTDPVNGTTARAVTVIRPKADLMLSVFSGDLADTFEADIGNQGPSDSSGSKVRFTVVGSVRTPKLPAGCVQVAEEITCDVGPVAAQASAKLVIPYEGDSGYVTVHGELIDKAEPDPNPLYNTSEGGPWLLGTGSGGQPPGPGVAPVTAGRRPGPPSAVPSPAGSPVAGAAPAGSAPVPAPAAMGRSRVARASGGTDPMGRTTELAILTGCCLGLLVCGAVLVRTRRRRWERLDKSDTGDGDGDGYILLDR
jgi:hypothetical protein